MTGHSFLFPSANTPWVYGLAEALAEQGHPTAAVALYDWGTYARFRPAWPNPAAPRELIRSLAVFPPGFMGRAEKLFRGLLRSRWNRRH